jgi:hypothetical protein
MFFDEYGHDRTMANVFNFVANATGYQNVYVPDSQIPLTNLTRVYPGPLNPQMYVPFLAPDMQAKGAGGQGVYVSPCLNLNMTAANAPAPKNLTSGVTPWYGFPTESCKLGCVPGSWNDEDGFFSHDMYGRCRYDGW